MDGNQKVWILEAIKNAAGIVWIVKSGDWFGSNQLSPLITPALIIYFVASTVLVYSFCQPKNQLVPAK